MAEQAGERQVDAWGALRGLSLALDLVMGRRSGHAQATAALGLMVGRRLGLPAAELADIALTALLKDAGCAASRPAFTVAVGTDDVAFHRHVFAMERYSPATFAALLWDLQRRQSDKATRRVWGWTNALLGLRNYQQQFAERNAEAARLADQLRCPIGTIGAIAAVGEHWDGLENPGKLSGTAIPIAARIVTATQLATVWGEEFSSAIVVERLAPQAGARLDPAVVAALQAILIGLPPLAAGEWLDPLTVDLAVGESPLREAQSLTAPLLAGVFADIVDAKSTFTAQHSHRVSALAGAMAQLAGALSADVEEVLLAGLLHDLGKLGVSNLVLDKNGPLDATEWTSMRRHPADSAHVLRMIPGWESITTWAAAQHERPDGRGYHLQREGETIPLVGRWLAVADAFDAMTADRPYREGLPPVEALRRLREGRGTQFDHEAVLLITAIVEGGPIPSGVANTITAAAPAIVAPAAPASPASVDSAFAAVPLQTTRSR